MNLVKTTSSTSFTQPATFGNKHHSLPYSILCDPLWGLHPNGTFSQAFQMGVPKLGLLLSQNFGHSYLLQEKLVFKHGRELSYSHSKHLSINILHAPITNHFTPALRGFVFKSQNFNLIFDPSFDYNSCILGLNAQCEGNLNICTSRPFQ